MNKNLSFACVAVAFFVISFVSCKKDGLNSDTAKKIQYRWERISGSSATDYLDGRTITWTIWPASSNTYLEFNSDGYFYDVYSSGSNTRYRYKVDGNKILYLVAAAGSSHATTPQYTDTSIINYVDDHLLVLSRKKYFVSGAYSYINLHIDSLKK